MKRDELIEAMARAMCELLHPHCDFKPQGSQYPSAWERERLPLITKATAALSAIEAVACVVPKTLTKDMEYASAVFHEEMEIISDDQWTSILNASPFKGD